MTSALKLLHAWTGLVLSGLLFTLAASGSLLVFKDDWTRMTVPGATQGAAATPARAASALATAEAAFPGEVRSVLLASPALGVHTLALKDGGGAYLSADGRELVQWGKDGRAADWLFDLHHHLFLGETGTIVTGIAGLSGLALALTGLALWWPQRRAFRPRVVPSSNTRPGWLSAHRNVGVLAAPLLILTLTTGSAMALPDLSKPLLAAMLSGAGPPSPKLKRKVAEVDWPAVMGAAQARFPDAALRIVVSPRNPGQPVEVRLRRPGEWHANGRTRVWLDGDGSVLRAEDALAAPSAARVFNAFWPLHAARVGGLPWRVLVATGGLSLALLSLYGAESYRRKLLAMSATVAPSPESSSRPERSGEPGPRRDEATA